MSEELNIEQIMQSIDDSNKEQRVYVDRAEAFERLSKTEDYKLVFEEGLFRDEVRRLTDLILTPNIKSVEVTENILSKIYTVRYMNEYFGTDEYPGIIKTMGQNAKRTIEENEKYRESVIKEDTPDGK